MSRWQSMFVVGVLLWGGCLGHRLWSERERRLADALERLDLAAEGGRSALLEWAKEELEECRTLAALPEVEELVAGEPRPGETQPPSMQAVTRQLEHTAVLLDARLRVRGAGGPLDPREVALVELVRRSRRPALVMLGEARAALAAPTRNGAGTVLIRPPLEAWLLPLLGRVPSAPLTGSQRLVWQAEGELRWATRQGEGEQLAVHRLDPAGCAGVPLHQALVLPAARGEREGLRGVPLLFASRQVPLAGGNWGLLIQQDRSEALAGFLGWATRELFLAGLLPLAVVLLAHRSWRQQQRAQARARAEEGLHTQLRVTQEQLRTATELSPDGFGLLEPVRDAAGQVVDLRYAAMNPAGLRILARADIVGRRLLEEFPQAREDVFPGLVRVLEQGGTLEREDHYQADGLDGWFRLLAVPTGGGLAISFADISLRKADEAQERALKLTLARQVAERTARVERLNRYLRVLSELNRLLAQDVAGDDVLREACRLACEVGGFLRAAVYALGPGDARRGLASHDRDPALNARDGVEQLEVPLALAEQGQGLLQLRLASDTPLDAELRELAEKLAGDLGRALRAAETRLSLRTTSQTLSGVIEASPVIVTILDHAGRVQLWNPAAERVLGWRADETLGRVLPTVPAEKQDEFRSALQGVLEGRPLEGQEVTRRRKDGSPVELRVYSAPLRDGHGRASRAVAMMVDVTERNLAEAALQATRVQLQHSQKMEAVGRLAGGVAHDFNNLLTVIQGYGQMACERAPAQSSLRRQLEQVVRAATRASELTRQLLAFSRRLPAEPRIVDPGKQLRDMEKMLRRLIAETIELRLDVQEEAGEVKVDPGQLEQVIMNLAVNARDAMPDGGRLLLEVTGVELDDEAARTLIDAPNARAGLWVRLAVTDTGVGMTPEVQAHLFEPFFTTKEQGKGTGLGLATAYGIVEQSGGFLRVESAPGEGARFEVWLPRVAADASATQLELAPPPITGGSERLLVAEDDPAVRELMREMLLRRGYRVRVACDAEEALRLLASEPADLLLTDLVMPKMSGVELGRRAIAAQPDLKVLYMSGYPREDVVGKEPELPAYLTKPVPERNLLTAVREALDARSAPLSSAG